MYYKKKLITVLEKARESIFTKINTCDPKDVFSILTSDTDMNAVTSWGDLLKEMFILTAQDDSNHKRDIIDRSFEIENLNELRGLSLLNDFGVDYNYVDVNGNNFLTHILTFFAYKGKFYF